MRCCAILIGARSALRYHCDMRISVLTRRDIIDAIVAEDVQWSGTMEEPEFLARLYDLSSMPSRDSRFADAGGDIWQHRVNNFD